MSEVNGHSKNAWSKVKLSEVVKINPKLPIEIKDESLDVSFLPMKLVEEERNQIHLTETRKYADVKKGFTPMADDDVIFAKITPCMENGKIAIVHSLKNGIAFGSTEFHVLRCNEKLNNRFLFYYLVQKRFRQEAEFNMTGAVGQRRVPKRFLEETLIPLLSQKEQQQIVSKIEKLFSELDKSIEQLKTAQQQLKLYRQSVLKWAFEGKLTSTNVPDTGFEPVSIAAEDEVNYDIKHTRLPQDWKWVKLGDVVSSVEYGSSAKSKEVGKIPVLRMGNIQRGRFDWDDLVYTSDEEEIKKYFLKKNDVLFNRTNSPELVGKTAIYKGERPAIFAGYLIRINRIEELIDANYLNYFLNSDVAKHHGNSVKTDGVNQSNINGQKLKGYPIPLAPFNEQIKIVQEIENRFSVADKLEETITNSLKQAEALRQSILKKAFEGKLTK